MIKILLLLINVFLYAEINIISWKLSDDISYDKNLKNELENYLNNSNSDIIVFQNLKKRLNLKLKNKFNFFIKNNYYYSNNSYYSFYIKNNYYLSQIFIYPDYFDIWKFPPVMLYIPKLNLSIINISTSNDYEKSIVLTNSPYTYIKNEIYDLKNVLKYFISQNIDLNNIIMTGDFGLDSEDIENIVNYPTLLKDIRITIKNHNYGNYNYNIISFLKDSRIKILKNTSISNYYPIILTYDN